MCKIRNTSQKQLILNAINEMYHPSAEEIYDNIRTKKPNIGRATVFRNVSNLTNEGKIVRINVPQGADRYDACILPHSHFICSKCKKICDVDYVPNVSIPENQDFLVEGYELTFIGVCKECLEKNGGK